MSVELSNLLQRITKHQKSQRGYLVDDTVFDYRGPSLLLVDLNSLHVRTTRLLSYTEAFFGENLELKKKIKVEQEVCVLGMEFHDVWLCNGHWVFIFSRPSLV